MKPVQILKNGQWFKLPSDSFELQCGSCYRVYKVDVRRIQNGSKEDVDLRLTLVRRK